MQWIQHCSWGQGEEKNSKGKFKQVGDLMESKGLRPTYCKHRQLPVQKKLIPKLVEKDWEDMKKHICIVFKSVPNLANSVVWLQCPFSLADEEAPDYGSGVRQSGTAKISFDNEYFKKVTNSFAAAAILLLWCSFLLSKRIEC